jgi:hypothetical protein
VPAKRGDVTARVWAEYFVTGPDIDPDALTAESGLTPTRVMRRGKRPAPVGRPPTVTAWCIHAERSDQEGIDLVLRDLIERLRPGWDALVRFGRAYDVHVVVSVEPHDTVPSLFVDRAVIQALADLRAWLDIGIAVDM